MKKTILFLLVAATFVFSACGTQKTSEAASTNTKTNLASEQQNKDSATEKVQEQATAEVDTTTSVGDNVTIHFPASLMNNDTSSKGLSTVLSAIDALGFLRKNLIGKIQVLASAFVVEPCVTDYLSAK